MQRSVKPIGEEFLYRTIIKKCFGERLLIQLLLIVIGRNIFMEPKTYLIIGPGLNRDLMQTYGDVSVSVQSASVPTFVRRKTPLFDEHGGALYREVEETTVLSGLIIYMGRGSKYIRRPLGSKEKLPRGTVPLIIP